MCVTVNALNVPVMGVAVRTCALEVPTVYFAHARGGKRKNGTKIFGGPSSLPLYSVRAEIYSCKARLFGGTSDKSANIGYVPIKT